ncbi:MAG: radical SAM protein [Euryarchaeota archaeon]|nr:radical SAM protein [Euryarchaeota archaeon]
MPEGCQLCIKGAKLVLFVTGLCSRYCYFCPISEKRKDKDVTYANERLVKKDEDIIEEAKLMEAEGTGITGGEPLAQFERTLYYIKLLKKEFGDKHHIHLYTNGDLLTEAKLEKLVSAGLDEIRLHPVSGDFSIIEQVIKSKIDVGCEIPVIPNNKTGIIKLAEFLENCGAKFLNLNELEFSPTNAEALLQRGLSLRNEISTGVKGSEELAKEILEWASDHTRRLSLHYCPARLKMVFQFKNRLLRRAKHVAKPYEEISDEGLLIKGIIFSEGLSAEQLHRLRNDLIEELGIPSELIAVDEEKMRLETAWHFIDEIARKKKSGLRLAVVKEYPTADRLEIEVIPL